ncbi:MAG: FHA domain-containing protein [Chitinophagaceae bacterium]|jgi:pSer/pThr/pTyr-binding forkhead associated (FHA) protein|nr:FHA domain-containing protein [Chitinophagaceae bacterium]MBP6588472.1 FHA domain-containing protein [Chitinophagaceae bacterium]
MTKEEIFEFLEIAPTAKEAELKTRIHEKMKYFSQLLENAPNDFIKKLHQLNLQKLSDIHQQLFHSPFSKVNTSPTSAVSYPIVEKRRDSQKQEKSPSSGSHLEDQQPIVAWLISHTENQPTTTYNLHRGRNIIGRKSSSSGPDILSIDDNYISRRHAVIECSNTNYVYDIGELEGKSSTNGIFLNANPSRISKKTLLHEGDTLQIGMTKLVFKINHQGNLKEITDEIEQSVYLKTVVIDL